MSQPGVDPGACPICQGDNACGLAAGRSHCWCFSAPLAPEVRQRVPAEAVDLACVCRACLEAMQHAAAG
jgi:hypothetical protein